MVEESEKIQIQLRESRSKTLHVCGLVLAASGVDVQVCPHFLGARSVLFSGFFVFEKRV